MLKISAEILATVSVGKASGAGFPAAKGIYPGIDVNFKISRIADGFKSAIGPEKVYSIMEKLFEYFTKNPEKLPRDMQNIREAEGLNRAVTDYIAGMTDGYAIRVFEEAYIPKTWQLQL